MRNYYYFVLYRFFFLRHVNNSTSPTLRYNLNLPVTTNTTNSFAFTVSANQYSDNIQNDLSFVSDSLIVTLTSSSYLSGRAIISVSDSLNAPIFSDTVRSDKTIAIVNLKTTKPKYCNINITNLTAKLVFVLIGQ